jgi:hypothetical protein
MSEIKITGQELSKILDIKNPAFSEFVSVEKLFPNWITARLALNDWVKEFTGLVAEQEGRKIKFFFDTSNKIDSFPSEDRGLVFNILERLIEDYTLDLKHLRNQRIDNNMMNYIKNALEEHEYNIKKIGGRCLLDELQFRLGLKNDLIHNLAISAVIESDKPQIKDKKND